LEGDVIELWNFCDTSEQRLLLASLLKRFYVVDSRLIRTHAEAVADHILNVWKLPANQTRIVATSDTPHADGSQYFLQVIKNRFALHHGWGEKNFINNVKDSVKILRNNRIVVLLDDFIGTGSTAQRRIEWFQNRIAERGLSNTGIKFVAIAGQSAAQ